MKSFFVCVCLFLAMNGSLSFITYAGYLHRDESEVRMR